MDIVEIKTQELAQAIAATYNMDTEAVYNTLLYNIKYNIIGMLAINEKHRPKINGVYIPLTETK